MRTSNRRKRAIRKVRYGAIASGWLPLGRPLLIEPLESRLLLSAEWPLEFGIPHDIPDALIVGPGEILSGNRAILGDVVNRGVLSPGNSPGVISINGNLTIGTSDGDTIDDGYTPPPASDTVGTIRMEIGGTDPDAPDYDQIHVTGIATLGGTLEVVLINDFVPEPGQTFDILTAAEINGEFDSAPGLWVQFDVEEATVGYLDINVVDNPSGGKILQLELVEFPGGLRYEPESDDQKDELGEFLNDIGTDTQTFTFAGSISVPGFAELSGEFTLEKTADGSKLLIGAADINAFLGTGRETPGTTDDVGLEVRDANLGVLVLTPPGVPSSFALTASGSVALAGLDGLSISGAVAIEVNKTGQTVDEVVSGVPVRFDTSAPVQVIRGIVAMEVDGAFALGGELIATKTRGGAVLVDIPELVLTVKPHDEELFTIGGGARFSIGGSDGFRLLDMGLNSVTAFGATFDVGGVLPRFGSSGSGGWGGADDEFAIELTSLPGLSVDAKVLNHRKYIDVTYFAPQGTVWDDSLIDISDFTLAGTGVADAEVDHVEWLSGDTFRYYLRDKDADNEIDLFVAGNGDEPNVELTFEAGSWANDSPTQTFAIAIRDGGATGAGEMSASPLTIKGPHIGIEDFQYKGGGHLAITLGIGAGEALLDFGNKAQQASSGISVQLTGLLGTFEVGADYVAGSWQNLTGAFGFQVEQLEATVPDVLAVTAAGIQVSYDPQDDTVGKEIITVDSASIEVPKVGATGFIGPYTRQDGTTIPGLRVRNNGFNLGTAGLTTDVAVDLEGILELTGVGVGVTDFGVTFGQGVDFNGEIFIAASGAKLFPGKTTFTATIQDGTDADQEAVRCALTFTDGRVDGFEFKADQFELKFGSYLTVTGSDILIDTGAGPTDEAVSLASLGAHLKAGPLDLSGQMRNFAFLGNGSFDTKPGFGVSFNRDTADSKAFKWPSWLPIRITSVGAKWRDISADPADFQITVSAAVTGLYNLPVKVSGAIEGLVIDVGLLLDGKFPVTRLESMTVGVEGKLFGGEIKGSLLGGILAFDNQGNVLDGDKPGVADRVFFVGLEGGFEMPGVGGMSIRLALSELGPLGVLITAATPTGILLEPVSGLTINDFVAGVEFFKTLPSITETDDLRDPTFAVSTDIDPADWLDSVQAQVVAQYQQIQNNPNQAGFLAAFTEPMLITAGCTLYSQYASRYTFSGDVQMKISTDGKFMAAGTLSFFNGALSTTARLYADLSQVASGNATILFLADVPDQLKLMVIQGKFQMEFLDDTGAPFEVVPGQTHDTSLLPVANLASPGAGGEIGLQTLKGRGYLDVAYVAKGGAEIDPSSILDGGAEFQLRLPNGTLLDLTGVPTQPEGFAVANKFRYALPQAVNLVPGEYTVEFLPGSFDSVLDGTRRTNAADTETFQVTEPAAHLTGPENGGQIDQRALNQSGHITVRFQPVAGSELDPGSILDLAAEFTLAGPGAGTAQLGQPTVAAEDANTYIYPITGQFGLGLVEVQFLPDGFRDKAGNRSGIVPVETFTVTGATADLLVRSQDVNKLNDAGYFDVRFSPTYLAAIDAGSILDPAAEFTLLGPGKGNATINDDQTEQLDGQTFRYHFTGNFTPGEVTVAFTEGSFQDTAGTANLGEEETLVIQGPTVELLAPQSGMAGVALSSVDLKFRPTWGNTLDENIVPQFTLSGSAVPQGVTVGNSTSLGDGVYRYTFSGDLQPGELKLAFAAGAVQDSAGHVSLAQTEVVTIVELTSGLTYPLAGSRVSLEEVNQDGYLDVTFADPLGVGLNVDSIMDQGAEITLWTQNDQGQEIPINGVHVVGKPEQLSGNTYRYGFSGVLPAGPVIVKYAAGSWTDTADNPGSAGEQTFLATRTAATLSIDVSGSIDLFAGSEDLRLLGISGGVSMRAEMGGLGTRVTVDMHGQIDLIYLGTVGASAGRFVFEDPDQGEAGMWGALRIDTNFKKLESLGIVLDAYCLLEVNTTNVERSETLTLAGQAKDGGDLKQPFDLGPEMFRIEAAGIAALHVPPPLNGGKLGRELARVDGALLLDVSREGIEAFAAGEILLGPPGVGFHAEGQGMLVVNDDGFAADVAVTQSFELGPVLDFESKAHVTLNVTGREQSVELPEEMLAYLPDEALDSLGGPNGRSYAVPAGPPQQNGQIGAAGVYVVVRAEGELTVGGGFGMQGDFWMEVSQEQFFLDASASLSLGLIGSLSAGGVFIADASGTRAWCAVDGQLGSDQLGLKLADAHGVFEVNTTGSDWSFDRDGRSILVPRGSFGVAVDASFDFPGFADGGGTASVTYVDNKLRLYLDGELHLGNRLNVDVDAYVGVYDTGVVVNAKVALDLNLLGILDVNLDGRLQINTTAGNVSRYEAPVTSGGNILYKEVSCVDANGDPTSIRAHSFFLDVKGDMRLLGAFTLSGQVTIDVDDHAWTIDIPDVSANVFGVMKIDAAGWVKSTGEFDLDFAGSTNLTWLGNGYRGDLNIHTTLDVNADPDFTFSASGSGSAKIAGVTVAGATIGLKASGDLGESIPITLSAEGRGKVFQVISGVKSFFHWIVSGKWVTKQLGFSVPVGTIQLPAQLVTEQETPPPLLAGASDGSAWDNDEPPADGILFLNVGDRAGYRKVEPTSTKEQYTITRLDSGTIRLAAFGEIEDFEGVTTVRSRFGTDDDAVNLNVGPVRAEIWGGSGNDAISYEGSGVAILYGDDGDDQVTISGTPDLSSELRGGAGNDTLINASIVAVAMYGEDGDDTITGADDDPDTGLGGDDGILDGGPGNDWIRGRGGVDNVLGGPGNDKLVVEIGELESGEIADGGAGEDQILIAGDSSSQDLRVTIEGNVVKVASFSGDEEIGSVALAGVEAVMLSGGEGIDTFSVAGRLELGGVTAMVIDMGSVLSAPGQPPGAAQDTLDFTLSDSADEFELTPSSVGIEGVWKSHFTLTLLASDEADQGEVNVFARGGDDRVTLFSVQDTYGTHPTQSGPVNSNLVAYFTDLADANHAQYGPTFRFNDIQEIQIGERQPEPQQENDPLVVDTTADESDGDYSAGDFSLREAIERANATAGADKILFAAGLADGTITLTSGELVITDDLAIAGPEAGSLTISGNHASRIFLVDNESPTTIRVEIRGLSLVDGSSSSYPFGGAIYNQESLALESCVLVGNSTTGEGGAIRNDGALTVTNTTLTSNSAGGCGGGIDNSSDATLTIINSTLVYNSSSEGGGGIYNQGILAIANCLVAGNTGDTTPDLGNVGAITAKYNVIRDGSGSSVVQGVEGNQVGVDPRLDPAGLKDHGGPTPSIALLPDSPAVNAGSDELAVDFAGNMLGFDQRGAGFPRIFSTRVDVGAFELQNIPPVLARNTGITLDEGAARVIDRTALLATDAYPPLETLTYTIRTNVAHGTFMLSGAALAAGGAFTQADIDAGRLSYTHDGGESESDRFVFSVSDRYGGTIGNTSFEVTIHPINDPPGNTVPDLQSTSGDTVLVFSAARGNGISIADADAGGASVRVELTVNEGTLTLASTTGLAFDHGDGTDDSVMRFTGDIVRINAALDGMSYRPRAGFTGDDTLAITTNDLGNTGSGGAQTDTKTVTIRVRNGSLSGYVYCDADNDGVRDLGANGLSTEIGMPCVTIRLEKKGDNGQYADVAGVPTVTTAPDGFFLFDDLSPGTYQILETQPSRYLDGMESVGTAGGTAGNNVITDIVLGAGQHGQDYNFAEATLKPEYVSIRLFMSCTPAPRTIIRNCLDVKEVVIQGTSGADTIAFTAGTSSHTVTVNGKTTTCPAGEAHVFTIDAGDGDDAVTLTGTSGTNMARSMGAWGSLCGSNYKVEAVDAETLTINGAGGSGDTALICDSAGSDTLTAGGNKATIDYGDYLIEIVAFERVRAISQAGGTDRVTKQAIDFVLMMQGAWEQQP